MMIGYIFKAENSTTHKTYIGKNYSVKFNKNFLGDDPDVLSDVGKFGIDKFTVTMLQACETVKECDYFYGQTLLALNAESDPAYYNCKESEIVEPVVETKSKKTRKKKDVEK